METEDKKEETTEQQPNPLFDAARKLLLASIGAVALAQDELESFVAKLVERGEIAEKDGRELINSVMEKGKDLSQKVCDGKDTGVEKILEGLDLPSKEDIQSLSDKIAALSEKVDDLARSKEG